MKTVIRACLLRLCSRFVRTSAVPQGQPGDPELAQELTNPLADLVTVPIRMYFDRRISPADDGSKITTSVQPVIPFKVTKNCSLTLRTIVPVMYPHRIVLGTGSQFGLGDTNLSFALSPTQPTRRRRLLGRHPKSGPKGVRFRPQANTVLRK